jgi:hypothetical protein
MTSQASTPCLWSGPRQRSGAWSITDTLSMQQCHPRSCRVRRHSEDVDPSGGNLDDEQHTYRRWSRTVSTWKKSAARIPSACADRNCRQVRSARRGAGSTPARLRSSHTVLGATRYPSCASSPWMRRYPQVGFSAAIRKIRHRSSRGVDGRPGGRWGLVQWRLTSARCQRSKVSGVTTRWCRRSLERSRVNAARMARPGQVGHGLVTCRRSTATSWRSTSSSAFLDVCPRASSASQPRSWQREPAEELAEDQVEQSERHDW